MLVCICGDSRLETAWRVGRSPGLIKKARESNYVLEDFRDLGKRSRHLLLCIPEHSKKMTRRTCNYEEVPDEMTVAHSP